MRVFLATARAADRLLAGVGRLSPALLARRTDARNLERLHAAMQDLPACQQALQCFGQKSDEDFTALAHGLDHLNKQLADLRTQAEQLSLILEDRDDDRALSSARTLYRSSVDLVHASMGTALSEQDQMKSIEEGLTRACGAHARFKRNHLMLRILTMGVRMEASRMDPEHQGVFVNVAAAIGEIGQKISTSTETAFARIDVVITEARAERANLKHLEEDLLTRAEASIQHVERELDALKLALDPCVEQSRAIAELFIAVGPETLRTISSLQHQDIVRQRLEHVAAGFGDIQRHLREERNSGRRKALAGLGYVHQAAGVQQAHLQAARSEIESAATEVAHGLQRVQEIGGKLVERFTAMEAASTAAFRDCRIARMFRDEIGQLANVADMSEKANDKISVLVERIAEVVRFFSQEISRHELDVKIVSLNAQIAAAHLPSADALNKLAEEASSISGENAQVTCELVAELQTSLDALLSIKRDADEFLGIVTSEKSELERGVIAVSEKLTRLGERVQSRSTRVREEFESTHREIRALLDGLGFPALVASSFEPAGRLCAQLLAATEGHARQEDLSAGAIAKLDSHRSRYTMNQENTTHAAVLGRTVKPDPSPGDPELFAAPTATASVPTANETVPAPENPPADAAGFGDGIELF